MLKRKKEVMQLEDAINHIKINLNQFSEDHFYQKTNEHWTALKEITAGGVGTGSDLMITSP